MLMPFIKFTLLCWIIRIILVAGSVFLWREAIRQFRDKKNFAPILLVFLSMAIAIFAVYEVDLVTSFRDYKGKLYQRVDVYHGFLGMIIYKDSSETDVAKMMPTTLERRYWGGFFGALPYDQFESTILCTHRHTWGFYHMPWVTRGWKIDRPFPRVYRYPVFVAESKEK